jgi:hypothetical protein
MEGDDLGWWCIHGADLLDGLRRAAAGEHPVAVYAEMYANSDHEYPGDGD